MATQSDAHAIWTDEVVAEAMYAIRNAINDWERVGAAEEVDLDEMAEVERRFMQALHEYENAMEFHERQRKAR